MSVLEKRGSERREYRHSLEVAKSASRQASGSQVQQAMSMDISAGGLGLETPALLERGEIVQLLMPMAGTDVAMPVFAEVRWARPASAAWRVGLQFLAQA
jgi:hypothetical protein